MTTLAGEALVPMPPGWRLHRLDFVDSTNDEAKREAKRLALLAGAGEVVVVWALSQTGGRGRRGRAWEGFPGNLYCSVLLRPDVPLRQMALLSFLAAVALADAVHDLAPTMELRCKWPNDVLCRGRKVAGILLETEGAVAPWLVLGMGVNVAAAPDPATLMYPASCLAAEGCGASAGEVLGALCHRLHGWLDRWRREGFAPVRAAWLDRAGGVGEAMTVRLERESLMGTFDGLDDDGALLLRLADGGRQRVMAGDVFFGSKADQGE